MSSWVRGGEDGDQGPKMRFAGAGGGARIPRGTQGSGHQKKVT